MNRTGKHHISAFTVRTALLASLVSFAGIAVNGAPFTPGNLAIFRVGDGLALLSNTSTAGFIDEYTPLGTFVQSVPLPTAGSGSNRALTVSGNSTAEALLSLSPNGTTLGLIGYDLGPGTATPNGTVPTTVNRVVGLIDALGSIDTTTALSDVTSNPRGAVTSNGTDIWVTGAASGVRYATRGTTGASTQLSTTVTNLRSVDIFAAQLYITTGSTTLVRIGTVGTGLPTISGQTITNLPGIPIVSGNGPYEFTMFDLDAGVAGLDTLYMADDQDSTIEKFSLLSGTWTSNGSIALSNPRGIVGIPLGSTVSLFATNGTSLSFVADTSGYNGTFTGSFSTLASAPTNTAFRGLAFAPIPEPGTVSVLLGGAGLLGLIRRPAAHPKKLKLRVFS